MPGFNGIGKKGKETAPTLSEMHIWASIDCPAPVPPLYIMRTKVWFSAVPLRFCNQTIGNKPPGKNPGRGGKTWGHHYWILQQLIIPSLFMGEVLISPSSPTYDLFVQLALHCISPPHLREWKSLPAQSCTHNSGSLYYFHLRLIYNL